MEPERIAERIWPGSVRSLEVLGGGITNRNFKVDARDGERGRAAHRRQRHGAPRDRPRASSTRRRARRRRSASRPEVIAFVEPEGYLVTRFVEGAPIAERRGARAATACARSRRRSAASTRATRSPGRFDPFRVVEAYCATAAARGVADAGRLRATRRRSPTDRARARPSQPPAPCHNDLLNANFIDDGDRHLDRRLGVRGHGRPLLRPRELLRQPRARPTTRTTSCSQAYFGEVDDEDVARARADALHVRLPRGDVGRRAAGDLRARRSTSPATPSRALRAAARDRDRIPPSERRSG